MTKKKLSTKPAITEVDAREINQSETIIQNAVIESRLDQLLLRQDNISAPVNNSQNYKPNFNSSWELQLKNRQDRQSRQPPPKESHGGQKLYQECGGAAPATSRTTCERRTMYTFLRGNKSADDESDADSESHFSYFEQDRLEARFVPACAAFAVDYMVYCHTQRSTGMMHFLSDPVGPEPTFTWASGEDVLSTPGPEIGGKTCCRGCTWPP